MHVLLPEMLQEVPLCPTRLLWQQASLPMLQQLEDQGGRPQVPLISYLTKLILLPSEISHQIYHEILTSSMRSKFGQRT